MAKYKNIKTTIDGITFDSKKEAIHYVYLKNLEKQGVITDLQRQTKIDFKIRGKKIFTYKPDFEYNDEFGHHIVDVKGIQTPVFKLKKKLIEAEYNIQIEII
jgi:hypothetical protein